MDWMWGMKNKCVKANFQLSGSNNDMDTGRELWFRGPDHDFDLRREWIQAYRSGQGSIP